MNEERLAWLLRCATRLRGEEREAINLQAILSQFGVSVHTISGETAARSPAGILGRKKNGDFVIGVKTAEPAFLWRPRDRFTIAHELGHLLLIRKWNYSPPPEQHREYFACEALCNRFAGHLLIDRRAISPKPAVSAEACLEEVRTLSRRFDVSLEVAAREFVQAHPGTMVCAVRPRADMGGSQILWIVSSLEKICQTRGYVFKDTPPEKACLRWYEKSMGNAANRGAPDACVRSWRHGLSLAALVVGQPLPQKTEAAPPQENTFGLAWNRERTAGSIPSQKHEADDRQLGQETTWCQGSQNAGVSIQASFNFVGDAKKK